MSRQTCRRCGGDGRAADPGPTGAVAIPCPRCGGSGVEDTNGPDPADFELQLLIQVAAALGRALHPDDEAFWHVVVELDKTFPDFSWHNSMTDSGSRAKPVGDE